MARFCGGATQSHPIENTAASLLSLLLGGAVLAWVRTLYTRLSGTDDRAPFRPERTGNFPVAANETAADMLCCALYPRIQTFPSTDLHRHGRASSQEMSMRSRYERTCGGTIVSFKLARAEVTDGYPCIAAQFHVHPSTRHAVLR